MNANAEKLVIALRSGEFKQADGFLRAEDQYCCLGVACELFRQETGEGIWANDSGTYHFVTDGESDIYYLPSVVQKWLGVNDPRGSWNNGNDANLAAMNDAGQSFAQIADAIEEHQDHLFKPAF